MSNGCVIIFNIPQIILTEERPIPNLTILLSIGRYKQKFNHPFESMKLTLSKLLKEDSLLITLTENNNEIAFSEVSLLPLLNSSYLEEWSKLLSKSPIPSNFSPNKAISEHLQFRASEFGRLQINGYLEENEQIKPYIDIEAERKCSEFESLASHWERDLEIMKDIKHFLTELSQILSITGKMEDYLSLDKGVIDQEDNSEKKSVLKTQEAEEIRLLLEGADSKLKLLDLHTQRTFEYREKLKQSIYEREMLEQTTEDTLKEIEREKAHELAEYDKLKQGLNEAVEEAKNEREKLRIKSLEYDKLKSDYELLGADMEKQRVELKNFEEMQEMIKSFQEQIIESEKNRESLRTNYKNSLKEYEKEKEHLFEELEHLIQENEEIGKKYLNSTITISDLENQKSQLHKDLDYANSFISELTSELSAIANQASKASEMETLAVTHQKESVSLQKKISELSKTFENEIKKFHTEKQNLLSDLKSKSSTIKSLEDKNLLLYKTLDELKQENSELLSSLSIIEEKLCLQEDTFSILEQIEQNREEKEAFLQSYYKEMEFTTDFLLTQSEENLKYQRAAQALKCALSQQENEIIVLRNLVIELEKYKAYKPMKDDVIDEALAEYIANRSSPLEVPFVREDQGIYLFGTKRVFMKLEEGKIILRVGGGYMHIDQFIDIYTPVEMEKIDNKKKSIENPNRKKVIGKLAGSVLNSRLDISPEKAAKIVKESIGGIGSSGYSTMFAVPRKTTEKSSPQVSRANSIPKSIKR